MWGVAAGVAIIGLAFVGYGLWKLSSSKKETTETKDAGSGSDAGSEDGGSDAGSDD